MAVALIVDKLDPDGMITVRHTFFGETIEECERLRDRHAAGCQAFGPANREGKTIERTEHISEIPEWEDDAT